MKRGGGDSGGVTVAATARAMQLGNVIRLGANIMPMLSQPVTESNCAVKRVGAFVRQPGAQMPLPPWDIINHLVEQSAIGLFAECEQSQ